MRNRKGEIIGLTARVGRDIIGSADLVADIITEGKSLLLLGYPGRGKTTAIRSMCKILADDVKKRVVIVDTSNEIAGDGDVPHAGIGRARRMQVSVFILNFSSYFDFLLFPRCLILVSSIL